MNSKTTQIKPEWIQFLVIATLAALSQVAMAVDIRGFGSAGVIQNNSSFPLSDYGTYDSKPSFSGLTNFGLNIHQSISDEWASSAQLVANNQFHDFNTLLEWGFISYAPSSNISFRAGRLIIPAWLNSQQINVGFNYPWVYLPTEVYALNPFHSYNGLSITGQFELGPGVLEGHIYGGDGSVTVGGYLQGQETTSLGKANNVLGGELIYNVKEKVLARVGYFQTLGTLTTKAPFTLPAGTLGPSQPTPLTLDSRTSTDLGLCRFFSAGIKVEQSGVFFEGEFVRRLFDTDLYQQASGFYASLGYRYHKWMPLYTYSWQGALSGSGYFHPNYPTVTALITEKHSSTFGLDYYMTDFVVLKGSVSLAKQNFTDATKNLSPTVYAVAANFIF